MQRATRVRGVVVRGYEQSHRRWAWTAPVLDTSHLSTASIPGRNFMFLGAPGAGKGTYSKYVSAAFKLPIVGTGDMIRALIASGSEHGQQLQRYSDAGELVPDEFVLELLQGRLAAADVRTAGGFILDGFPRTLPQAEALQLIAPLHLVLNIIVPDEHVIAKLVGRRGCDSCGASYNVADVRDDVAGVYMPPMLPPSSVDMLPTSSYKRCSDAGGLLLCGCGSQLSSRSDDCPDVIGARLAVYHRETSPLIEHYRGKGVVADYRVRYGMGDMEGLVAELSALL